MFDLALSDYDKAMYQESARLAGYWLVNSQNTPGRPWGEVHTAASADNGRFLEKTCPSRNYRRPAGVWLQALSLAGLVELLAAPVLDKQLYRNAIELGARYLTSLQCFDVRWPKAIGGFHEVFPGDPYSAPRDAATGALGLISLYQHTDKAEYLDRAVRFGEWYCTHGSDADGYPWDDFDLAGGVGTSNVRGDWQAGGALVYFQLHALTGEQRWLDAMVRVLDVLETVCATAPGTDTPYDFHGACILSLGNDDFANTALLAGYKLTGKASYLKLATERMAAELGRQADNGAFPGYGGTFVTALELIEALDLLAAENIQTLPADQLRAALMRAVAYSLTLQERTSPDRYMLGGVYGQSNYGTARDIVHSRDTVYAIQLWLRMAGHAARTYTTLGWHKR